MAGMPKVFTLGFAAVAAGFACVVPARANLASLLKNSPFLPAGSAPAAAAAAGRAFELTSVVDSGGKVLLSITDTRAKRSWWLPVGGGNDELSIVSYDDRSEQATVRSHAATMTLALREARIQASAAPSFAAVPPDPVPLSSLTPKQQATEARMFVSDLLEIGQQQRKAYEAAHPRAGAEADRPAR